MVLLFSLSACDKGEPAPKPTPAKTVEAPKPVVAEPEKPAPEKPTIAAPTGLFGCKTPAAGAAPPAEGALPFKLEACPTIPSTFGTLAWGMDQAAAAKAIKGVKFDEGGPYGTSGRFKIGKDTAYFNFSSAGKVDQLRFKTSEAGLAAMIAAWGAPLEYAFLGDKDKLWFNPATKTKVEVEENSGGEDHEKYTVRMYNYTPLADLLGADGILAKPIIGSTGEELEKNFPEWLEVKSAEQAKAEVAAMGLDAKAAGVAKWAGVDQASIKLVLPAAETESSVNFSLEWTDDKKVKSFDTSFSYQEDDKAIRAEIPAVVAAALGQPTSGTKNDEGEWTYNFAGPNGTKVQLRDLGRMWNLAVSK